MGWHPRSGRTPPYPKIDLIPAEPAQLGDAQPTAVGDQDLGGIAVPVPVLPCSGDQALDFFRGQVFAGAALGLGALAGAELSHFQWLAWWFGPRCSSSHAGSSKPPTVPF